MLLMCCAIKIYLRKSIPAQNQVLLCIITISNLIETRLVSVDKLEHVSLLTGDANWVSGGKSQVASHQKKCHTKVISQLTFIARLQRFMRGDRTTTKANCSLSISCQHTRHAWLATSLFIELLMFSVLCVYHCALTRCILKLFKRKKKSNLVVSLTDSNDLLQFVL